MPIQMTLSFRSDSTADVETADAEAAGGSLGREVDFALTKMALQEIFSITAESSQDTTFLVVSGF